MTIKRGALVLCCLAILKIAEYVIIGPRLDQLAGTPNIYTKLPRFSHPRCDACRAIALRFDAAFREEDSKIEHLGQELSEREVADIVNNICSDYAFKYIELVEYEGYVRLATPPLETWDMRGRPALGGEGVHWPERMAKHCHYFAGKMKGIEIYDLWLRTGHSDTAEWVEFLCEGEGVFADCLSDISADSWPAEVCLDAEKAGEGNKREIVKAYLNKQSNM